MNYFEESIFTTGFIFKTHTNVAVSNQADKYLVERFDKQTTSACDAAATISVNPKLACRGINIYTLSAMNVKIGQMLPFNQIRVIGNEAAFMSREKKTLTIDEYERNIIYSLNNDLTSIEAAIMIKYYAINHQVFITNELYHYIEKEFKDYRKWFHYSFIGNLQKENHEIVNEHGLLINRPQIMFVGPIVTID